jgi:hypothetical protein
MKIKKPKPNLSAKTKAEPASKVLAGGGGGCAAGPNRERRRRAPERRHRPQRRTLPTSWALSRTPGWWGVEGAGLGGGHAAGVAETDGECRWSSGGSGSGRNPSAAALASVAEIDLPCLPRRGGRGQLRRPAVRRRC